MALLFENVNKFTSEGVLVSISPELRVYTEIFLEDSPAWMCRDLW